MIQPGSSHHKVARLRTVELRAQAAQVIQPWGSWLELAFPDATVAIDSRIELFPVSVWNELAAIDVGSEGWQEALGRWAPTMAVVARDDVGLRGRLAGLGWTTFYDDRDGFVLEAPSR